MQLLELSYQNSNSRTAALELSSSSLELSRIEVQHCSSGTATLRTAALELQIRWNVAPEIQPLEVKTELLELHSSNLQL